MSKDIKFTIAVALQAIIILAIVIFKMSVLTGGSDVILRIQPIDPRDPLRGDYVTFTYTISSLSSYYFTYTPLTGDTVYVPLIRSGDYWTAARGISKRKPSNGELFIKATVKSSNRSSVRLVYGIEEYFIPEGTGQGVSFWRQEASARVSVDENGNAVLKQLYVDGQPWP